MYEELEMKLRATSSFRSCAREFEKKKKVVWRLARKFQKKKRHTTKLHPLANDDRRRGRKPESDNIEVVAMAFEQRCRRADAAIAAAALAAAEPNFRERGASVSVSLGDGSSTSTPVSMSEGAALHCRHLFRSMLSATAFREARERHVDLSAHDADTARLVIEFLESEFESNGRVSAARGRASRSSFRSRPTSCSTCCTPPPTLRPPNSPSSASPCTEISSPNSSWTPMPSRFCRHRFSQKSPSASTRKRCARSYRFSATTWCRRC
jgi:hypothetical protein